MSFLDKLKEAFDEDDFDSFKKVVDALKNIDMPDEEWGDQNALVMISNMIDSDTNKFKYGEYLIDKGAKINQTCGSMSPLLNASRNGAIEWMKVLIKKGANVNYYEGNNPPINEAIRGDVVESLQFLLSEPTIDLDSAKEAALGQSLMQFAKIKKAKQCIELLKQMKVK